MPWLTDSAESAAHPAWCPWGATHVHLYLAVHIAPYAGRSDQCWTPARIGEVVRRRFGVDYTLAGLDLLLHRIGWSVQVPARKATERDEPRIAVWKEEQWPVIRRGRRSWAPGSASRTRQVRV
ncbi:winged helix-turn-helix domain-containing protein [Streptomyces sp. NPDC060223]|uniref:helix-turn-helix domain-containing protein n=1 Tax=unclassified Streptomyces TaxID=2593676 RepID=UPI0036346DE7